MKPPMRKTILWLAALTGALLLVGGGILSVSGQSNPPQNEGGWLSALLEEVDERLRSAANPTEQALLEDKRSRLEQVQQARQESILLAAPTLTLGVCPPPEPTPNPDDLPQGIFELDGEGDYQDIDLMAVNGWRGQVNGNAVTALAGWRFSNPAEGLLVVFTVNAPFQEEPAPRQGGALRILSADGNRLTLSDEQGSLYYYDLAARRWLSRADEVVPTLPPLPTYTPAAVPCP